jgi:uncharacterized OsmC-like protein
MARMPVGEAIERARKVLARRPELGLQDDAPAIARWREGTRVEASHANGACVATDMPAELGGSGREVTPGWLFRAGLASCAATTIAMHAAAQGIELTRLEVTAASRSDARGLLGLPDADGALVHPGPGEVRLHVRIAARGVSTQQLRELVGAWHHRAPVSDVVESALPIALQIDAEGT